MTSERTKAEMARGAQVVRENIEKLGVSHAVNILSRAFNPNHVEQEPLPPKGYASWKDFHARPQLDYLPNERDGTPKNGT